MIFYFVLALNGVAFGAFGYDKYLAKNHQWRIAEKTLLGLTAVGGSCGAVLAMLLFRHKTSKPRFYGVVGGIIVVQIIVVYGLVKN